MPAWFWVLLSRVQSLFRRRAIEADFERELAEHLDLLVQDYVGRGMRPAEALRQAHLRLGGVAQLREANREASGLWLIDVAFQDVRHALRGFRRHPGFAALAVATLAVGIGLNCIVFGLFDAVALRGLAVANPDSLVRLSRAFRSGARGDLPYYFSYAEYVNYRDHSRTLSGAVAASRGVRVAHDADTLEGQLISANYFSELGVDAALGRLLVQEDGRSAQPAVVLSWKAWQERFNGDAAIVGRSIRLGDRLFAVAGIAPQNFIGTGNPPRVPDFWALLTAQPELVPNADWLTNVTMKPFQVLARLRSGATLSSARAELTLLATQSDTETGYLQTIAVSPEHATLFGGTSDPRFRMFVVLIMTVTAIVLVIACANLSNMTLARAASRQRELGVRLAIGASRARLIRQMLTESLLLAVAGGLAGLLLSTWGGAWLQAMIDEVVRQFVGADVPQMLRITPDLWVFGYTLLISAVAGIAFGLAPALQFSRADLSGALKDDGHLFGLSVSRSRLRTALIAGQVAASLGFLAASGLLVRGAIRSQAVDPGIPVKDLYAVTFNYPSDRERALELQRKVFQQLESSNELAGVCYIERVPLLATWSTGVADAEAPDTPSNTLANHVSASYFDTMGIRVERGRSFLPHEQDDVAVVSASAARQLWPGRDAIGRRLRLSIREEGAPGFHDFAVVGMVQDARTANVSRVDPMYVYLPTRASERYELLVRTRGPHAAAIEAIRTAIAGADRTVSPSVRFLSLDKLMRDQQALTGTLATFATLLAGLGLLLASVGVYGVMSFVVTERVHEIGVRMALGARRVDVVALMLADGLRPVLLGVAPGLAIAFAFSSVARAMLIFPGSPDLLFGLGPFDPSTFVLISGVLASAALAASTVPTYRATRVDPIVALRVE